ncbi:MAG: hypothetical protein J3Q66DRAFT_351132 [Benniella sp.]|nr:MAG: hypothetical protein J3Q66DRAFT_351132 [Benniella sp.]
MYSFHPHTTYTARRQHRPGFQTYTTFQAPVHDAFTSSFQPDLTLNDDTDEEELLLRAALERKQRERLARQQIRQQLQRQEQERYEALIQQERARQLAIAQAQAQYQAEQEAIQRFKRAQWIREQKQRQQETAFIEALVRQQARAAQQQKQEEEKAAYCRARAQAIANAERQACPSAARPTKGDEDPETLSRLLEVLFFPQQEKRHQPQEENYPCKRRHQACVPQQLRQDEKAKKDQSEQEAKAKKALDDQKKKATTPQQEFQDALPTILSFVEAIFGGDHEPTSKAEAPRTSASASTSTGNKNVRDSVSTPAGPSPSSSSPELRATDILRQRQQQKQQQTMTLQQKHSELNTIESALDSFSRDLTDVLDNVVTESNKRIVLSAEENISKAMLQIDSVESDGNLSVRQRRKELIKKSQDMLDLVDTYKNQQLNTGKKVVRSNEAEAETEAETNSQSSSESLVENEAEVVERETVQSEEPAVNRDVDPLPTDLPVAYDRDENDGDEVIEPYSITEAPSTPLVAESTTVQDATESLALEVQTHNSKGETRDEDEDEDDDEEDDDDEEEEDEKEETVQERSTTVESVESDESSESSESMHDDYEMVPDF